MVRGATSLSSPRFAFKARVVKYLQLKSFIEDINSIPLPSFEDAEEKHCFQKMCQHFFPAINDLFCAIEIESTIIEDVTDKEKLMEWLAKLLFRASRDGWTASDFQRMCDGKGATIAVAKGSAGYVLGGYSDVAWSFCTDMEPHTASSNGPKLHSSSNILV